MPRGGESDLSRMQRVRRMLVLLAAIAGGACAAPPAQAPVEMVPRRRMPIVDDSTAPVGSRSNPIRGNGPFGEREYLSRLRCASGAAPAFEREGSIGAGGDGHILDAYSVSCPGGPVVNVFMDMYHDARERRPVPPLSVLPELPARTAAGCPPQAGPTPDSSARYVFNYLEVETPAQSIEPLPSGPITAGIAGYAMISFVIDTTGKVEPASIVHGEYEEPRLQEAATRVVLALRFRPAEHHAGCRVRQGTGLELVFQ